MLTDMKGVLDRIYEFCGWEKYEHNLNHIHNLHQEDDEFYGLEGFHTVRKTVSKDDEEFELPAGFKGNAFF
jgi:hypothetical protein